MANLSIVGFHNSTGAVMNNATTATDSKVVLSVIAGAVADCRPANVRFVRLQLELDFVTSAPALLAARSSK